MPLQIRTVRHAVLAMAALYAVYFSVHTCLAHQRFETGAYDLGTFDQGIWLAGHGTDFFVTVRGLPLLGDHVRVFSFVLAPLYWLWNDVRALLVLQSVVIAAGAWFLFRIASRELPGRPWLVLALCASYLLHPAVQNLNLDHAHPDAFASTFVLAAMDFLHAGRLLPFAIAAALAMSCKEDVPLVFVALGLALMLDRRRRRLGLTVAAAAAGYFALCMLVILPYFNGVGFFRFGDGNFLAGVGERGLDPLWFLAALLKPENAGYLFKLGLPNLYLFLFAPVALLPAVPALAVNLLSSGYYMRDLAFHYQTSIVPFLYLATVQVLARKGGERSGAMTLRRTLAAAATAAPSALIAAAIVANVLWSRVPIHRAPFLLERWGSGTSDQQLAAIHQAIAKIPGDAAVSADYTVVPHLSHRRGIYLFPNPFRVSYWGARGENPHDSEIVEYIVVRDVPGRADIMPLAETLAAGNRFERIAGEDGFALYRKVALGGNASCGDWNGDGRITANDARWIGQAILRNRDCPPRVCDADGDGVLRFADAHRIGKRVQDPQLPLACPP